MLDIHNSVYSEYTYQLSLNVTSIKTEKTNSYILILMLTSTILPQEITVYIYIFVPHFILSAVKIMAQFWLTFLSIQHSSKFPIKTNFTKKNLPSNKH